MIDVGTAKVFFSGNSQAVRLPKEYRIQGLEVGIRRIGKVAILFPINQEWEIFLNGLNGFTDDFLADGRYGQVEQMRESL